MCQQFYANEATKPTMLSVVGTKYRDSYMYNNVFKQLATFTLFNK